MPYGTNVSQTVQPQGTNPYAGITDWAGVDFSGMTLNQMMDTRSQIEKNRRKAAGMKNWDYLSPEWTSAAKYELLQNQISPTTTQGGFSGVDYGYFTDMLKGIIEQGDPNQALYRQRAQSEINKSYGQSQNALNQQLAQSGLLRSGALPAVSSGIEAGRAGAMGQAEVQLAAQDQAYRQQALQSLLGLQELGLSETSANRSYLTNLLGQQQSTQQFYDQLNFQKSQSKFNFFRDLLPGLIQGVGQVGAAYAGKPAATPTTTPGGTGSDIRLKENIKKVGVSEEGIPVVEFNYKGSDKRFRGVIAQDVETIKPEAVIENEDGIKLVDYSLLSVNFESI